MHVIAAKAVAFKEAQAPGFKAYQAEVIANARLMAKVLQARGARIVSGGTDCHLFLVDLRAMHVTGRDAEDALGRANITVNKNSIPNDPEKPTVASGIRIGSPAITTRGFGAAESEHLANLIADVLEAPQNEAVGQRVANEVEALCLKFPVYAGFDAPKAAATQSFALTP
jgi:glycine hydroxymethyltransferase